MGHTGAASAIRLPHVGHRTMAPRAVYDAWCRRRTHLREATQLLTNVSSTGARRSLMRPPAQRRPVERRPSAFLLSSARAFVAREPTPLSGWLHHQPHLKASDPGMARTFDIVCVGPVTAFITGQLADDSSLRSKSERANPTAWRSCPGREGRSDGRTRKEPTARGHHGSALPGRHCRPGRLQRPGAASEAGPTRPGRWR
jgi:hypothetical protein